jgi:single-strand DNA-binding protein
MSGVNIAIIVGRLGKDPELRHLPDGTSVVNFSVATSESWVDRSGQKRELTEWHSVVVFGKVAENCAKYLKKGSLAGVNGKIQTRSWEKDGQKHYKTEIKANSVQFLSSPKDGQQGGQEAAAAQSTADDWPTPDGAPGCAAGASPVEDVDTTFSGAQGSDQLPF